MNEYVFILLLLMSCGQIIGQEKLQKEYPKSLASYGDFKDLVNEVEDYRAQRLINLDEFVKMSKEKNVVILDTRSNFRYSRKHIKGAIHLDFSDFTQEDLWKLIPDTNTKILIYCNNNFEGDQIDFTSKITNPKKKRKKKKRNAKTQTLSNKKPIMLALNIPTFINLYGYGYKNIYELDELVNVNDERIEFEGTTVKIKL
ncbi:rhodanese-like domain-containing protein [Aquimarina algicola]|uniref:Rhodanese-like domain-containing protein n=1 Tax=Aquimarina algicola TaxID=2589995 RepID=A0A504J7Y1_9FLAO|nr:rhodanese-like domain-containing protein [Aquimarina algicola]TPN86976.1 rhodanese-like domain-containing protein [Aquimarina algicola]